MRIFKIIAVGMFGLSIGNHTLGQVAYIQPSPTSPDMIPPITKEKSTYWNKEKVATSLPPKISDAVQETSVSGTKNDGMSNTMPPPTPKTSKSSYMYQKMVVIIPNLAPILPTHGVRSSKLFIIW